MSGIRPADGLTIKQLLSALREQFVVIQTKHVGLTLDEEKHRPVISCG